jgi:hypothetical protein
MYALLLYGNVIYINHLMSVHIYFSESGLSEDYSTFEILTSKDMSAVMANSMKYFYRNGKYK